MHRVSEETQSGDSGGAKGGGGKSNGVPRKVVPLREKRDVSERHLVNLRASGLTDETIELAGLYTETVHKALAELMQRKVWPRMCGAALVFPFYLPGGTEPIGYRVRPTYPRTEKRGAKTKQVKYDQSESAGVLVYFTPRARVGGWYGELERPLYWTEGEKKALVFDQLELCCVGLTGVWNWGDWKLKDETGEERMHPALRDLVTVAGRHHVICFDADSRTNEQVMLAAARLAGVLRAAGAASVRFVCPPSTEHKGIDDYYAAFGPDVTRQLLSSAEHIEPIDPKDPLRKLRKIKALRDAPIGENLRLPDGYDVQRDGSLWRNATDPKHGDSKISRAPLLIQRYLDDYYTHDGRVDVCFERDDRWVSVCVARKAIADSRTMVAELSAFGAPVTSNNASKLVDFVEDLERVNAGKIERVACVGRAGWHSIDGERVFVLDEPVFGEERQNRQPLALDCRGDRRKMFGALKCTGDRDKHIAALQRAWNADPVAAAVICGALAAPLLEPLCASNFAIHLSGESTRGKTTTLKIGASVYGDPHNEQWVTSWNTTSVAAELRAAVLTDLPQCYDEVSSSDPEVIERMVYMLINGGGRARGQRDLSLRETPTWRTVVLSTGERQLADESMATGAQVRVIQFPVVGFGQMQAAEIDEIREACAAGGGAFGRLWIETLLGIDDWGAARESLKSFTKGLRGQAKDPLHSRVATYFAVLAVAEGIAHQLGLGCANGGTIVQLFRDQGRRERVRSLAERSLHLVKEWVATDQDTFPALEMSASGVDEPRRIGTRTLNGYRKDGLVLLFPKQFKAFCDHHKLAAREVVREWEQRGWTQHDAGRTEKSVRVGTQTIRFYAIDMELEHTESA